jgi:hypothetical protein
MDTANSEKLVVSLGDPNVTARCARTNRLYEVGSGALPHAEQTANFVREAARDGDMPKSGEICDRTGRPYEVGSGCLPKAAQTAAFLREANPVKAAAADRLAMAEVKNLAATEDAALAALANPFVTDPDVIPTKH